MLRAMVYCPACGQEQTDETKFCRFCGDSLPGAEMMKLLRQEALELAAKRNGGHLTETQAQSGQTMQAIEQNRANGGPINVQNGVHAQSAKQATDELKALMR